MNEITYCEYIPVYRDEVLSVLKDTMPGNISLDWFRWKHEKSPFGPSKAWIAKDSEGIVGCNFFMEYQLIMQGEIYKALRSCESAVLPRGRRKGIFSKLVQHAQAQVDNQSNYFTLFGTPNENSTPGFMKLGWAKISPINYAAVPIIFRRYAKLETDANVVFNSMPINSARSFAVNKTRAFLEWRYGIDSGRTYKCASLVNGNSNNGCVYKLRSFNNFQSIIVMELWGDKKEKEHLIQSICFFEKSWFAIIQKSFDFAVFPPFTFKNRTYDFIYYKPNIELSSWFLSLGDLEDIL